MCQLMRRVGSTASVALCVAFAGSNVANAERAFKASARASGGVKPLAPRRR
jgi:hypothetical protein